MSTLAKSYIIDRGYVSINDCCGIEEAIETFSQSAYVLMDRVLHTSPLLATSYCFDKGVVFTYHMNPKFSRWMKEHNVSPVLTSEPLDGAYYSTGRDMSLLIESRIEFPSAADDYAFVVAWGNHIHAEPWRISSRSV